MSENRFRKYVKDNIEGVWGLKSHISLVESPDTSAGIPDCDLCIDGIEAHIELKYSRDKKCFRLRPTQIAWFRRRARALGRRNFILWCQETGNGRSFHIIPGYKVPSLGKRLYDRDIAAVSKTWEGKIDWPEFFQYLADT